MITKYSTLLFESLKKKRKALEVLAGRSSSRRTVKRALSQFFSQLWRSTAEIEGGRDLVSSTVTSLQVATEERFLETGPPLRNLSAPGAPRASFCPPYIFAKHGEFLR